MDGRSTLPRAYAVPKRRARQSRRWPAPVPSSLTPRLLSGQAPEKERSGRFELASVGLLLPSIVLHKLVRELGIHEELDGPKRTHIYDPRTNAT